MEQFGPVPSGTWVASSVNEKALYATHTLWPVGQEVARYVGSTVDQSQLAGYGDPCADSRSGRGDPAGLRTACRTRRAPSGEQNRQRKR